jgi:hypothetical protein
MKKSAHTSQDLTQRGNSIGPMTKSPKSAPEENSLYVNYKTFRAALDKAPFPEALREYLSEERMIATGRQRNSSLRFLRAGHPQTSEALWDSNALKNWMWRKYQRIAPVATTEFINALDELTRRQQVETANDRDRKARK